MEETMNSEEVFETETVNEGMELAQDCEEATTKDYFGGLVIGGLAAGAAALVVTKGVPAAINGGKKLVSGVKSKAQDFKDNVQAIKAAKKGYVYPEDGSFPEETEE